MANVNFVTLKPGLLLPPPFFCENAAQNLASVRKLAALEPRVVCFGHGPPLYQPELLNTLVTRIDERARRRTEPAGRAYV